MKKQYNLGKLRKRPEKVKNLLHRCHWKDPRERMRDIGDARIELNEASDRPLLTEPMAHARGVPKTLYPEQ